MAVLLIFPNYEQSVRIHLFSQFEKDLIVIVVYGDGYEHPRNRPI